jgi:signal transduction histidine kinase
MLRAFSPSLRHGEPRQIEANSAAQIGVGRELVVLRLVASVSWLLPLLLGLVVAWQTWQGEKGELDSRITSTLNILSEQVERVLENQTLALGWIDDRARTLTWGQIERSRDLFAFTKALADESPYIDAIFFADASGIVRATSSRFPLDRLISIADRDYFIAATREPTRVHIGEPIKGRLGGNVAFRVAKGRSVADGTHDGIIAVTLAPSYIEQFFANIRGAPGDSICLMRTNGEVLLSNAEADANGAAGSANACTRLLTIGAVGGHNIESTVDGIKRMGGARQLSGYPLAVAYAVELASIRDEWLQNFALYGSAALASSLVLFGLSFAALRIAQNERRAIEAWREEVEQRRRIEAEMRQASKIEALGRMAGGIAHHFNNLLPAMSALLKLTLSEVAPGSATAKRLQRMGDAVAQGQRLVRNILLFSRRQVMTHERIPIAALIEETVALLEGVVPPNVRVVTRIRERGDVIADASQLQEVLMNLISNAAHAIGSREGIIDLETSRASVDANSAARLAVRPGEFVHVVCRDNGEGMTSEVVDRAFDPFFTTKSGAEGTGLGLAIVHGVVTGLGGGIRVDSTPGVGTELHLYLPLAPAAERAPTAA